ncbi:MAG: MFS transporter [Halobacteriaceae archaeon]
MSPLQWLFGTDADILDDRDFQVLLLASVMAPLGSALVSPILDSLTGVYGVAPTEVGLVVSAFTAPGIVAIPLAGTLGDRYGRKPVLVASLLLFGLAGGGLAGTAAFPAVLGLRALQGVGFGGLVPMLITSLGDLYEGAAEATAQGLRITVVGASLVVFPAVAGRLVVADWRWPFGIYLLAVPLAAVVWWALDEPGAAAAEGDADGAPEQSGHRRELWALATRPSVAPLLVARSLPTFVWLGFFTYNSIVVVRILGGTPAQAGLLVAAGSVTFALSASQAGRLTAAADSRFRPLVGAHLAMLAGFGVLAVAPTLAVAGLGVLVGGLGFGLTTSLYRSVISSRAPARVRGGLVGAAETLGRVAATLAPVVMGAVVAAAAPAVGFDGAVRGTMLGVAVVCSLGGVGCLLLARAAGAGAGG